MGKHFSAEVYRQLEKQSRRDQREDEREEQDPDYQDWSDSRREREIELMRGDW